MSSASQNPSRRLSSVPGPAASNPYETKICALLALRYFNPTFKIKNFEISQYTTQENNGLVLKLQKDSEDTTTFFLQLKHFSETERKKTLKYATFHEKKSLTSKASFNLQTYWKCISEKTKDLQEDLTNVRFVLFTNKDKEEGEKRFAPCTNKDVLDLVNLEGSAFSFKKYKIPGETTKESTANAVNGDAENNVENEIDRNFLKKLVILCKQPSEEDLSHLIKYAIQGIFKVEPSKAEEVVTKYIDHICNWLKGFCGECPLRKEALKLKLGEFVLSPYMHIFQPNFASICKSSLVPWIKMLKNYRMVIVENCKTPEMYEECIAYVLYNVHLVLKNYTKVTDWNTPFTPEELKDLFARKRRNKKIKEELLELWGKDGDLMITLHRLCLYFWHKNMMPLVVRIRREDDLRYLLNISNFTSGRFVVFFHEYFTMLPQMIEAHGNGNRGSIVSKLLNLHQADKDFILDQPITFQGRKIKVRDVLHDERIRYQIYTVDLVQILLKKFNIGLQDFADPMPGCPQFINRYLNPLLVNADIFKERTVHIIFCKSKEVFTEHASKNNMEINDEHICLLSKNKDIPSLKIGSVRAPTEAELLEFPKDRNVLINVDYDQEEISTAIVENHRDGIEYKLYDLGEIYGNLDLQATDPNFMQTVNVFLCSENSFDSFTKANGISVQSFEVDKREFTRIDPRVLPITLKYILATEEDDLTPLRHACKKNLCFHIYKLHPSGENFGVELVGFFGESSRISEFLEVDTDSQRKFDYSNCFLYNHLNLITGSPGMGKSVLINHLVQACPTRYLTVYINFNLQSNYFIDKDVTDEDTVYHLKHFIGFDNLNTFEQNYIDAYLQNRDVCIFFDGFDEIPQELEGIITKFLQDLLKDGFILFVTTRHSRAEFLESKFASLSRTLLPFSDKDRFEYLVNCYKAKIKNAQLGKVEEFVVKLLPVTKKKMSKWDSKFAAVPLQTHMVSEIYLDDCRRYCSNPAEVLHFDEISDILDLYEKFMQCKSCSIRSRYTKYTQEETVAEECLDAQNAQNGLEALETECEQEDLCEDNFEPDEVFADVNGFDGLSDYGSQNPSEDDNDSQANDLPEGGEEAKESEEPSEPQEDFNKMQAPKKPQPKPVPAPTGQDMSTKNNQQDPLLNYKLCAFKSIFFADNSEVNLTRFIEEIVERKDRFGIIDTFLDEDTPVFVHRTFAEYLIAVYITENVSKPFVKFLLAIMLSNPVYDIIRQLVDRLLAKDCPLHKALLSGDEETFKELLKNEAELMKVDLGGRNVLHLGMSWGARHEVPGTALLEVLGDETDWDSFKDRMQKIYADSKEEPRREAFLGMILKSSTDLLFKLDEILHVSPLDYGVKVLALENINLYLENLCKVDGYFWIVETNIRTLCKYDKEVDNAFSFDHKQLMFVCSMFDYSNIALALIHLKPSSCDFLGMKFGANDISLLHFAAWFGSDKVIDLLTIIVGIPIDVLEKGDGHSPLHWASGRGNISTVNLLLERQANWKLLDVNGLNPLYFALKNRQSEVVSILTEWDNKSRLVKPKITKFFGASVCGDLHEAKLWLSSGENPNEATDKGWRPLMLAAIKGHIGMVKLLLDFGAEVNATHANNYTALMWAAYKGHVEVVKLLIGANADVNWVSDCGSTALSLAVKAQHLQVVELLRQAGAVK